MSHEQLSTDRKALQINLDADKYGTFAEIGAGQKVARWFFHVGGAAGTVAKTISAYDMAVSDAIYGPAERYVSRQRLEAMLQYEFDLLLERLDQTRGDKCIFFAFANTVATRSFSRQEEGRGWMGIRFQTGPRPPSSSPWATASARPGPWTNTSRRAELSRCFPGTHFRIRPGSRPRAGVVH